MRSWGKSRKAVGLNSPRWTPRSMNAFSVSRALSDDLVVVEFGELGVLVALGDEEARDQHPARQDELLKEGEERSLEERLAGEVGREHALAHGVEQRRDDAADDGLEQLFLGLEVDIGQALADFGARGNVLEPGRRIAVRREFLEGRGDDLLRARVLARRVSALSSASAVSVLGSALGLAIALPPRLAASPCLPSIYD